MRTYVFTRDDGSQVLVTIYRDGTPTIAERRDPTMCWGPPLGPDTRTDRWDRDDERFFSLIREGLVHG